MPLPSPSKLPDAPMGRAREVEQVERWLAGDARVVSLVGVGGVGKTVLARAIEARWLRASTTHASVSVALDGVTGPLSTAQCARELAAAFGDAATPERIASTLEGRSVLVRIEAADHALETVRALVRAIRERAPDARLVLTSRIRLGVDDEQVLPLLPFSDIEASRRLFADATRAQFGTELELADGSKTRAAVDAIVLAVEGHPLAIRLAASRAGFIGLAALAAEAPVRLSFFDAMDGEGSALDRCLDSTYEALSEAGRDALELAGCFRGGFTFEAWKDAFGRDTALEELGRYSLLHVGDEGRLDVLSPVRAHARRRRESGRGRREHLAHYAARARTEALALEGLDHRRAFTWLVRERANLLAALETAQESALHDEEAWLWLALLSLDRLRGGEHLHHAPAAAFLDAHASIDADVRALLLASIGVLDAKQLSPRASERLEEASRAATEASPEAAGLALQRIGMARGGSGDLDAALDALERAEAAFGRTSQAHGVAQIGFARSIVWRERGDSARAAREHERAVGIQAVLQVAIDDYPYWSLVRGLDALDRERPHDAAAFLDAAMRGAMRDRIPWLEAHATIALGLAHALSGAWERARVSFIDAEALARRLQNGWVGAHAATYGCLVAFARDAWDRDAARPFATAAAALRAFALEDRAAVLERLADRWLEEGEPDAEVLRREVVSGLSLDASELRLIDAAIRAHVESRSGAVLLLDPTGARFRTAEKAWVDLTKRPVARALLAALVEAHHRSRGLSPLEVRDALWPDERMLESAAKERIHATVKIVRDLGLRPVLTWKDGVYRLEGAFRIAGRG